MKVLENLLHFAPLLVALVWASVVNARTRRIPNALTFALAAAGMLASFFAGGTMSPWHSLFGLLAGLGLVLPSFCVGGIGGGDVKLLAAVGAWVGPVGVVIVYLAVSVVGMLIVLVQASVKGRLMALFRNSAVIAINLAHLRRLGADNANEVGQSCRSIDEPLPYAVPVLAGVLVLLAMPVLWG
jgi:prepilin peptidase CpaA